TPLEDPDAASVPIDVDGRSRAQRSPVWKFEEVLGDAVRVGQRIARCRRRLSRYRRSGEDARKAESGHRRAMPIRHMYTLAAQPPRRLTGLPRSRDRYGRRIAGAAVTVPVLFDSVAARRVAVHRR